MFYYENINIIYFGIITFIVLFKINDASAKTVSYVQNCHETDKSHIPQCPEASMCCLMLQTYFIFSFCFWY